MIEYIVVSLGDVLSTGVDRSQVEDAFKNSLVNMKLI